MNKHLDSMLQHLYMEYLLYYIPHLIVYLQYNCILDYVKYHPMEILEIFNVGFVFILAIYPTVN